MVTPRRTTLAIAAAALILPAAAAAQPAYTTVPGASQGDARFIVSYKGEGSYHTVFHATPPNPGGNPDTNDAHDTSRQKWAIAFQNALTVPTCGPRPDGSADPCTDLAGLSGARGPTSATGRVNHKHVDGLYRQLDRTVKCKLNKSPSRYRLLDASLKVRYIPESDSIGVSASNPVSTALALFPAQCPKQGDSIDRILDFYATPGFSFSQEFGPDRWFASREVVIPTSVFHDSKTIRIPLRTTQAGRPPRRCAVRDPSFERCKTGGEWSGVLTLMSSAPAKTRATAAAVPKVLVPKSGKYSGRAGPGRELVMYTSGKSIQIVAFDFACGSTTGRTSLNDVPLKKSKKGYRFAIKALGSASFRDGRSDENVRIDIQGRFARTGKAAIGTLRVRAAGCPDTGVVKWSAKR